MPPDGTWTKPEGCTCFHYERGRAGAKDCPVHVPVRGVGFWGKKRNYAGYETYVIPAEAIDPSWNPEERGLVVTYLSQGSTRTRWRGYTACGICGIRNGSTDLTDGEWVWPQGYVHYLVSHEVKPPKEFVEHVLAKMGRKA